MKVYNYPLNLFFNEEVSISKLHSEIISSSIMISVLSVSLLDENIVQIEFVDTLSSTDKNKLDTVVENHRSSSGIPDFEVLETVMIVPAKMEISSELDWQKVGGVVMAPSVFNTPIDQLFGQVTGLIKTENTSVSANILEGTGVSEKYMLSIDYSQMNSNSIWVPFVMRTNQIMVNGFNSYQLLLKKSGAGYSWIKHVTFSTMRFVL